MSDLTPAACARGVSGQLTLPDLKQSLSWQRRADRADASCAALWPQKAGWLQLQDQNAGPHALYVYATNDWPEWQAAERRDATARYAARSQIQPATGPTQPAPSWPFALAFAAAMLLLWWRERR